MLIFNTVIFVLVIRVLVKHSRRKLVDAKSDADRKKNIRVTIKTFISIVSVMFMFGLTWVFGAFTIAGASIVFQWLFVIFNSLQGFFLFFFFCVISKDARQGWIQVLSCGKYDGKKKRERTSTYATTNTVRKKKPPISGVSKVTEDSFMSSPKTDRGAHSRGATMRRVMEEALKDDDDSTIEMSAFVGSGFDHPQKKDLGSKNGDVVLGNGAHESSKKLLLSLTEETDMDEAMHQVPPHIIARFKQFKSYEQFSDQEEDSSTPRSSSRSTNQETPRLTQEETALTQASGLVMNELPNLTQMTDVYGDSDVEGLATATVLNNSHYMHSDIDVESGLDVTELTTLTQMTDVFSDTDVEAPATSTLLEISQDAHRDIETEDEVPLIETSQDTHRDIDITTGGVTLIENGQEIHSNIAVEDAVNFIEESEDNVHSDMDVEEGAVTMIDGSDHEDDMHSVDIATEDVVALLDNRTGDDSDVEAAITLIQNARALSDEEEGEEEEEEEGTDL